MIESFFENHAEKFDFLPTESPFVVLDVRCVYLEKNSLLRSSACIEESTFQKAGLVLKKTDRVLLSYAVGILEQTHSAIAAIGRCCIVNIISGF